uniref:Immediate early response 2b n=1 Tax=Oryzias latipes TaxID=8090 RepID=A0A3P9KDZ3_ORYLA
MEVNVEARRILAVSISKLYASRSQRGGLRLHRSLLLSMVMRSARDIYHSSRESEQPNGEQPVTEEPMDTNCDPKEKARLTRRRSTEAGKFEEEPADDSCQFNESRQVTAAESKRVDV